MPRRRLESFSVEVRNIVELLAMEDLDVVKKEFEFETEAEAVVCRSNIYRYMQVLDAWHKDKKSPEASRFSSRYMLRVKRSAAGRGLLVACPRSDENPQITEQIMRYRKEEVEKRAQRERDAVLPPIGSDLGALKLTALLKKMKDNADAATLADLQAGVKPIEQVRTEPVVRTEVGLSREQLMARQRDLYGVGKDGDFFAAQVAETPFLGPAKLTLVAGLRDPGGDDGEFDSGVPLVPQTAAQRAAQIAARAAASPLVPAPVVLTAAQQLEVTRQAGLRVEFEAQKAREAKVALPKLTTPPLPTIEVKPAGVARPSGLLATVGPQAIPLALDNGLSAIHTDDGRAIPSDTAQAPTTPTNEVSQ